MTNLKIDDIIKEYVRIRDELDAKRKKFKEEEKELKDKMEQFSMVLRDKADELGVNSFNTEYGTAYRSTKTYARVGNWAKVIKFIKETNNYQMLEKRISKLAAQEVIEELDIDPVDIGIEYGADVDMLIRRPDKY